MIAPFSAQAKSAVCAISKAFALARNMFMYARRRSTLRIVKMRSPGFMRSMQETATSQAMRRPSFATPFASMTTWWSPSSPLRMRATTSDLRPGM